MNVVVGWLSQQHASVSQGWICSDSCKCCHTGVEVTDPACLLGILNASTSLSADPVMPGAWQGSHWSTKSLVRLSQENIHENARIEPRFAALEEDALPVGQ